MAFADVRNNGGHHGVAAVRLAAGDCRGLHVPPLQPPCGQLKRLPRLPRRPHGASADARPPARRGVLHARAAPCLQRGRQRLSVATPPATPAAPGGPFTWRGTATCVSSLLQPEEEPQGEGFRLPGGRAAAVATGDRPGKLAENAPGHLRGQADGHDPRRRRGKLTVPGVTLLVV